MRNPPLILTERTWELTLEAAAAGEVPVGSLVYRYNDPDYEIIAENRNRILEKKDPTAHSEILTLRDASSAVNSERLTDLYMITSLEPCLMCTGALILARIKCVYYFASEQKGMGMNKIISLSKTDSLLRLNHYPEMIQLTEYEERTRTLLKEFFKSKRT
jgi:tRNA(adenine34) deaminase